MNLNGLLNALFPDSMMKVDNGAFTSGNFSKDKSFEFCFSSEINGLNLNQIDYSKQVAQNPFPESTFVVPTLVGMNNTAKEGTTKDANHCVFTTNDAQYYKHLLGILFNYLKNVALSQDGNDEIVNTNFDIQTFLTEKVDEVKSYLTENLPKCNISEEEITKIIEDINSIANQVIPLIINSHTVSEIVQSKEEVLSSEIPSFTIDESEGRQAVSAGINYKGVLQYASALRNANMRSPHLGNIEFVSLEQIPVLNGLFGKDGSSSVESFSGKPNLHNPNPSQEGNISSNKIEVIETNFKERINAFPMNSPTQTPSKEEGVGTLETSHTSGIDKGVSATGNIPLSDSIVYERTVSADDSDYNIAKLFPEISKERINTLLTESSHSDAVKQGSETIEKFIDSIAHLIKGKGDLTENPKTTNEVGLKNSLFSYVDEANPKLERITNLSAGNLNLHNPDPSQEGNFLTKVLGIQPELVFTSPLIKEKSQVQILLSDDENSLNYPKMIMPISSSINVTDAQNVKSELNSTTMMNRIDVINQIIAQIQNLNLRIEDRIKIKLEPERLGSIELELSIKDGKTAILNITTDTNQVKEAIQQNISQLKEGLNKLNIKVELFNVNVNTQNQNNQSQSSPLPLPVNHSSRSLVDQQDKKSDIRPEKSVGIFNDGRLHIIV